MKIIKAGEIPKKFWWIGKRFSCQGCKCVFELEEGDMLDNSPNIQYICPTCNSTILLKNPDQYEQKDSFFTKIDYERIFNQIFGNTPKI